MAWGILQSSFLQTILSLVPATIRKSLEAPPTPAEELPPSPSVGVEPWKEEVDRWKHLADKTAAERDQLRNETTQLHNDLQRASRDLVQAEEGNKTREQELLKQSESIKNLSEEVQRREEEIKTRDAELKARDEEIKTRDEEIKASDEEIQKRDDEVRRREGEVKQKEEELEKVREDLKKAIVRALEEKQEKASVQALLEKHGAEVAELKLVAGMDVVGEEDVLKLLQKLNSEIAQAARATREMFKLDKNARANGKVATEAAGAIEGWVGSALPGLLSTQYRGNVVLIQAALQALAVAFSSWISSSYSFMHEHDQILDETYKYVMNSENQAVLGRWRALTHKYAKQGMPNLVDELTKMFITDVRNLLLVAGSSTFQIDNLVNRRRDSFRSIVESAINLRKAIGEDIVSCDFETVLIHPGDSFDSASMENAHEPGGNAASTAKVVCTSAMGLRRCKKMQVNSKGENQWDVTVLQKPQVVLESVILSGSS